MTAIDQQKLVDYLEHILQAIVRIEQYTEDLNELGFWKTI